MKWPAASRHPQVLPVCASHLRHGRSARTGPTRPWATSAQAQVGGGGGGGRVGCEGGQRVGSGYEMGFQRREDEPLLIAAQAPPNLRAAAPPGAHPAQGHPQALVTPGAQEQHQPRSELGGAQLQAPHLCAAARHVYPTHPEAPSTAHTCLTTVPCTSPPGSWQTSPAEGKQYTMNEGICSKSPRLLRYWEIHSPTAAHEQT